MSGRRTRHRPDWPTRAERRHVQARVCVSCRRVRPKSEMVRIVRTSVGTVVVSATEPGRGAYVCPEDACLARARRRLAGALRVDRIDFQEIARASEAVRR